MSLRCSALILAAGYGKRLRPLTGLRSKPAVPLLNRPLIHYSLDLVSGLDLEHLFVNLHHLPDTVRAAVARHPFGRRVSFSEEPEILGTAGALWPVRQDLAQSPVFLCNGKIYFEQDGAQVLDFHRASEAAVTMVLSPYSEDDPFSPVLMDEAGRIVSFSRSRPCLVEPVGRVQPFIFTGVHVLDPQVLDFVPEGPSDTVRDVYPRVMAAGLSIMGFVSNSFWCECSTPGRYLEKSLEILQRRGREGLVPSGPEARWRRVVAGAGVTAPSSVLLEDSILWEGVRIGPNSSLRRSIVTDSLQLPAEIHLKDVIVTPCLHNIEDDYKGRAWTLDNLQIWPLDVGGG